MKGRFWGRFAPITLICILPVGSNVIDLADREVEDEELVIVESNMVIALIMVSKCGENFIICWFHVAVGILIYDYVVISSGSLNIFIGR